MSSEIQNPRSHGKRAAGPGHPPQGRTVGRGKVANPGPPSRWNEVPSPGRPCATPQHAKPAPKCVRCGFGDGPPCPHSPLPRKQRTGGAGRLPQGRTVEEEECPMPDIPQHHQGPPGHTDATPSDCTTHSQTGRRGHQAILPHTGQAEHESRSGNVERHGPPGTALPAPCTGTARSDHVMPTRVGARTSRERECTHTQQA